MYSYSINIIKRLREGCRKYGGVSSTNMATIYVVNVKVNCEGTE